MPHRSDSETHLRECIENTKKETLDSLFRKNKAIWRKYVDADDFHISISALPILYRWEQFWQVEQPDQNSLYRLSKYDDTDITAANIYQFLGSREDEGHGTICEDEADNIDESPDRMRINKNGYTATENRLIPVWLPTASSEFMVLEECWNISRNDLQLLTYYIHHSKNLQNQ